MANPKVLSNPNVFLKIIALVLTIVDIGIMRGGANGSQIPLGVDQMWLVIGTCVAYVIILTIFIVIYVHEGVIPVAAELLTVLLGVILFLASGSVVIDTYSASAYAPALALGSMCIITAFVLIVDLVLLAKKAKK